MGMHPKDKTLPFTQVLSAARLDEMGFATKLLEGASAHGYPEKIKNAAINHKGLIILEMHVGVIQKYIDFIREIKTGNTIVVYGFLPSQEPEMILESGVVDYCISGEGEGIIPELVKWLHSDTESLPEGVYYMDGASLKGGERTSLINTDDMPYIPAEVLQSNTYSKLSFPLPYGNLKWGFILGNRGCLYNCLFCTGIARQSLEKKYRLCSPERLVGEIEHQITKGDRNIISIEDDLFTGNRKWVDEVLALMEKLPKRPRWIAQTRLDCLDEGLIKRMSDAGCVGLTCGVESGSDTILNNLNKNINTQTILDTGKLLNRYGITTRYTVMIGSPGEDAEAFKETEKVIKKLMPLVVQVYFCTPYTDTNISDNCSNETLRLEGASQKTSGMEMNEMETLRNLFYRSYYLSGRYFKKHFVSLLLHAVLNIKSFLLFALSFAVFISKNLFSGTSNASPED